MKELKKHQLIRYTEALEKERDEYKANYEMLTIESEYILIELHHLEDTATKTRKKLTKLIRIIKK